MYSASPFIKGYQQHPVKSRLFLLIYTIKTLKTQSPAIKLGSVQLPLVAHTGFEPVISALRGRCPKPLDECAISSLNLETGLNYLFSIIESQACNLTIRSHLVYHHMAKMTLKSKISQPVPDLSLSEAVAQYLISLSPEKRQKNQPALTKFLRWYGESRAMSSLTGQEIEGYTAKMTSTMTGLNEKIDPIKEFLSYAHKQKLISTKMAHLLKAKKNTTRLSYSLKQREQKSSMLTPEGYATLQAELKTLIAERPKMIEEVHKAAADKDFRENAPLAAAREHQGKVEGRIMELETILKSAVVMNDKQTSVHGASIGDNVVLKDLLSGEIINYALVDVREANPSAGKISVISPIGKALMGHKAGEKIEVNAPAGMLPYQIEEINRS
jgi:transcription elongation factor GreA